MAWFVVFSSFFFLLSCNKLELIGEFSVGDWVEQTSTRLYTVDEKKFDMQSLSLLKKACENENISFVLACGSWCSDTKEQGPKFFAILEYLKLPENRLKLFGVSINKQEPASLIKKYNIEYVPTMILVKNGKEIGRIVESPVDSWEEDMLKIIEMSISE